MYGGWKNMSTMPSLPLGWLKNTKSDQWIIQFLCCSCSKWLEKDRWSICSLSLLRSSKAESQFNVKISAASFPQRALRFCSASVDYYDISCWLKVHSLADRSRPSLLPKFDNGIAFLHSHCSFRPGIGTLRFDTRLTAFPGVAKKRR